MNLFDWSIPFVMEKVTAMWNHLVNQCTAKELKRLPDDAELEEKLKT